MSEGYKMTELGDIPESWEIVTFGSILSESPTYGANASSIEFSDKTYRYLRITDINDDGSLSDHTRVGILKSVSRSYLLNDDDIIIARTGNTVGKSYLHKSSNGHCAYAGYLIRFVINKEIYSPKLFFHFLHSKIFWNWVDNTRRTGAQPNINSKEYQSLKIPLPPLPEQQKIASILSTVDEKIEVIDAQISQTHELKKGLMQQLLTKGIGHTKFKSSELGDIPESWEVKELAEVSAITRLAGYEYSEYWKEDPDGEILTLRGFNIGKNKIVYKNLVRISNELSMQLNRSRLYKGDVVFPCVGTIGNAVVIEEDDKFHINQNIAKITPAAHLSPYFLTQYLISDLCRKEINRFNATTSQPNVLVGSLRKFRIPVPSSKKEQEKIAELLMAVDSKLDSLGNRKETYQQLKKGLMQQLLTGKMRVNTSQNEPLDVNKNLEPADLS